MGLSGPPASTESCALRVVEDPVLPHLHDAQKWACALHFPEHPLVQTTSPSQATGTARRCLPRWGQRLGQAFPPLPAPPGPLATAPRPLPGLPVTGPFCIPTPRKDSRTASGPTQHLTLPCSRLLGSLPRTSQSQVLGEGLACTFLGAHSSTRTQ